MPELPEVETIRRELEPVLVGQTVTSIEVLRDKSWSGDLNQVKGAEIVAIKRKAKILFIKLSNTVEQLHCDTAYLMIHLKMTGQLIYEATSDKEQVTTDKKVNTLRDYPPCKQDQNNRHRIVGGHPNNSWTNKLPDNHTRVVIKLSQGTLYFNDQRVFGWVKAVDQLSVNRLMSSLPPDIVDVECDSNYFYQCLQSSRRPVKLVILDSQKIGGVGNIYANDGLFDAGIDPSRPANKLNKPESDRLLTSLKKVVNLGIQLGGATAADGKFVNTGGLGGKYQDEFLVYEQAGKVVERDGKKGVVEKFKLGGRGTYWVPELQQ